MPRTSSSPCSPPMAATAPTSRLLLLVSCIVFLSSTSEAFDYPPLVKGLSFDFYKTTCPSLESVVRNYLKQEFKKNIGLAAALLRVHFHDCFVQVSLRHPVATVSGHTVFASWICDGGCAAHVQGCDGSILLDGSAGGPGEQDAPPNLTLRPAAFKALNDLQVLVTQACGQTVSCADIAALAARDSVHLVQPLLLKPNHRWPLEI